MLTYLLVQVFVGVLADVPRPLGERLTHVKRLLATANALDGGRCEAEAVNGLRGLICRICRGRRIGARGRHDRNLGHLSWSLKLRKLLELYLYR